MDMKNYKHLDKKPEIEFDWTASLMQKSLPPRAFANDLTANIVLSVQAILVKGLSSANSIRTYFQF